VVGEYSITNPVILPFKDKYYRASKPSFVPKYQAVLFHIVDISGSMAESEKELVRLVSSWVDCWFRSRYTNIITRYIIHHHEAKEVDQYTFYYASESGGTIIASAYRLIQNIVRVDYPLDEWNIYIFHYSDGEDYSLASIDAVKVIRQLLPVVSQITYCEVRRNGNFLQTLKNHFGNQTKIVTANMCKRDKILDIIKSFGVATF